MKKIDSLSVEAKCWLHHAAQQINDPDADGFVDNKSARIECVSAGLVIQRGRYIEIPGDVNDLVYSHRYLEQFA